MNKRTLEMNAYTPPRKIRCVEHNKIIFKIPDNYDMVIETHDTEICEYYEELDPCLETEENWMPYIT